MNWKQCYIYLHVVDLFDHVNDSMLLVICLLRVDNSLWSTSRQLQRPALAEPYTSSFASICRMNSKPRFLSILLSALCLYVLLYKLQSVFVIRTHFWSRYFMMWRVVIMFFSCNVGQHYIENNTNWLSN